MKGTIRIMLGILLVMGGVGGMEADVSSVFPLIPTAIAFIGLAVMAWGVAAANRQEQENV